MRSSTLFGVAAAALLAPGCEAASPAGDATSADLSATLVPPPVSAEHAQAQVTSFLVASLPTARYAFVGPMPLTDEGSGYSVVAESDTADGASVFHVRGERPVEHYIAKDLLVYPFDIALADTPQGKSSLTFFSGDPSGSRCTVEKTTVKRDASGAIASFDVLQPGYGSGDACAPLEYRFTGPIDVSTVSAASKLVPHYPSLILEAERRELLPHDGSGRYTLSLDVGGLGNPEPFNCGHDVGRYYAVSVDVDVSESAGPGAPIRIDAVRVTQVKPSYCSGSASANPIPTSITVTTPRGHFQTGDLEPG